jgi:hypothetical protein
MSARRRVRAIVVLAIAPLLFARCGGESEQVTEPPGAAGEGGSAGESSAVLPCIAPLIAEKCATSGCHDAETREHGMDLSTGDSIYGSWVNHNGLSHCRNTLEPRVVPGDPEASYVYRKVTGDLECSGSLSQAMPPPPLDPLTTEEVALLAAWIRGGATKDCQLEGSAGTGESSAGASAQGGSSAGEAPISGAGGASAGQPNEAGAAGRDDGSSGAGGVVQGAGGLGGEGGQVEPPWDPWYCDSAHACPLGLICAGELCSEQPWQCVSHFSTGEGGAGGGDDKLAHPCPEDTVDYCGCDGVTFTALRTCPDRPYAHPGACDDGYSCDVFDSRCELEAPSCEPGQAPLVEDDCFAGCAPIASCRCDYDWECPEGNTCHLEERRCEPEVL